MSEYYEKLGEIDFFKLHPSYIPFVGTRYEKYRILQISESHWVDELDTAKYGIAYFSRWFDEPCPEVEAGLLHNNKTRRVCENVCENVRSYPNFDNPLRSFMRVALKIDDPHTNRSTRQLYQHFAYMNFYPMPAFKKSGYFKAEFLKLAKREGMYQEAEELLDRCRRASTELVDRVIDILNPKAVVITSFDASDQYNAYHGKYARDPRMIYTSHPGRPWHKAWDRLEGKTGRECFEARLKELYG